MFIFMRFPGGLRKVVTLSYDDGVVSDIKLMEICKRYGLKCTFNLSGSMFSKEGEKENNPAVIHKRLTEKQARDLYIGSGMEVAVHSMTHPFLEQMPENLCVQEIIQDRTDLERIFGGYIRGMAYPMGTTGDSVVTTLKQCGIVYARTAKATHKFDLPTDWLRLDCTCRNLDPDFMDLAKAFAELKPHWASQMFYLFGHSYEFDDYNSWDSIEEFAKYMGGRDDIWYATNIEIYDYCAAYKQLLWSMDRKRVYNPTVTKLWFDVDGKQYVINAGEEIDLG